MLPTTKSRGSTEHRGDYDRNYVAPALAFVRALGPELQRISKTVRFEPRINGSLFRIQRDTRFSKTRRRTRRISILWFWEGKDKSWSTPGFFFRPTSKQLIIGAGMHQLDKPKLDAFRKAVVDSKRGAMLSKLLTKVKKSGPYTIGGATRKSVPRGFDPEHARAELLLHEGLFAILETPHPKELGEKAFVGYCRKHFAAMAPVSNWLEKNV